MLKPADPAPVALDVADRVARLTMTRPRNRNSFTEEFDAAMRASLNEIARRDDVGAVILTGTDGVFSAGGDIKGMVARHEAGDVAPEDMRRRLYAINEWVAQLRDLELPVIAAVDGPAYGGGFALALTADFVLCSPTARFCASFCRIGLVPDCAIMYSLPRIVGVQRATEILATGRPVDAEEAVKLGIALEIHAAEALQPAADALAARLATASPTAFALTKRITGQSLDLTPAQLLEMEAAAQAICLASEYHADAVRRFTRKEPLAFNWEATTG